MRPFLAAAAALILAGPALAWETPGRGSDLRSDLMDAVRPHVEWVLGAPVQFVVHDLRVAGDVAFASLTAQRPGGAAIDLAATPGARRGEIDLELGDGATIQALLQKSGRQWVATHHAIGATDAWWSWQEYCPVWQDVIPEVCPR
jgi:hypothetical protein